MQACTCMLARCMLAQCMHARCMHACMDAKHAGLHACSILYSLRIVKKHLPYPGGEVHPLAKVLHQILNTE